jgi:RNA polymerase sigma-70 factor, ECF subfamily
MIDDLDALAAEASRGGRRPLEELLAALTPIVERYCRTRLGARERPVMSSADLAQDVLLSVITSLPRWRLADGPFLAFVYGIAAHKVANAFRSLGRDRSEATSDAPELLETAESASGPEETVMGEWTRHQLYGLLDRLPDRQREVLALRTVVGLSVDEVANATGSTPGAVRIAQHRALSSLRQLLAIDLAARRPRTDPVAHEHDEAPSWPAAYFGGSG